MTAWYSWNSENLSITQEKFEREDGPYVYVDRGRKNPTRILRNSKQRGCEPTRQEAALAMRHAIALEIYSLDCEALELFKVFACLGRPEPDTKGEPLTQAELTTQIDAYRNLIEVMLPEVAPTLTKVAVHFSHASS